jgi:hypothetical protein
MNKAARLGGRHSPDCTLLPLTLRQSEIGICFPSCNRVAGAEMYSYRASSDVGVSPRAVTAATGKPLIIPCTAFHNFAETAHVLKWPHLEMDVWHPKRGRHATA